MTEENREQDHLRALKTVYFQLLDETLDIIKQPVESIKKVVEVSINAQNDLLNSAAKNGAFIPVKEIIQVNSRILESYTDQLAQSKKITKNTLDALTDVAITWQSVAAEIQKSALNSYKSWLDASGIRSAR